MVNLMNFVGGNPAAWQETAERAVTALERIADQLETPPELPVVTANGWLPNMNPEVGVHAQLGCRLMFDYAGPGPEPVAVWCNTHDVELPLILPPAVPPLDDAGPHPRAVRRVRQRAGGAAEQADRHP